MSAEEDMKHREMALMARLYSGTNTKLVDDRSLEQRYQQAIQQLDRQKQKLYEDIERVIKVAVLSFHHGLLPEMTLMEV